MNVCETYRPKKGHYHSDFPAFLVKMVSVKINATYFRSYVKCGSRTPRGKISSVVLKVRKIISFKSFQDTSAKSLPDLFKSMEIEISYMLLQHPHQKLQSICKAI